MPSASRDTSEARWTRKPSLLLLLSVVIVAACHVRDSAAQPNPLRAIEAVADNIKGKAKGKGKDVLKKGAPKDAIQKKGQGAIEKKKRELTTAPKQQPGGRAVDVLQKGSARKDQGVAKAKEGLGKDAKSAKGKEAIGKDAKSKGGLSKDAKSGDAKSREVISKDAKKDGKGKDALTKTAKGSDGKANLGKDGKGIAKDAKGIGKANLGKQRPVHVAKMPPAQRRVFEANHRRVLTAARDRIPRRPLPGETGFTGVPPATETRYVSTEMVFQAGPNVTPQQVQALAQRQGVTIVGSQPMGLAGGTLYHIRITDNRRISDEVRAWENERVGVAQPNYVFLTQQDQAEPSALPDQNHPLGDPAQYVLEKLRIGEIHQRAKGSNVKVAVIDSLIDINHPDLAGQIEEQFDAVGGTGSPHAHGTGMTGAIVAQRKLLGIAPGARILAVRAFSPGAQQSPEATTRQIIAGIEWAIGRGARVINMSFAGPHDPMLALAMKRAHEKNVVLIAASGNAGAKSPPLYPAADPHVIAVTATGPDDKLMPAAVRGPHVAVSAPGIDVMVPAPDEAYNFTTGTSVAAAHVSGVAALLLERHPTASAQMILEVLTSSARRLGTQVRDDQFGWGLVDPAAALEELDERMAAAPVASAAPTAAPQPAVQRSATAPPAQPASLPVAEAVPLPPRRPPAPARVPAAPKTNSPIPLLPQPATVR